MIVVPSEIGFWSKTKISQTVDADGNDEIDERYYLIQSMLPYFAATKNTIADGHFMDEAMDTEPCLRAFKEIFEIME